MLLCVILQEVGSQCFRVEANPITSPTLATSRQVEGLHLQVGGYDGWFELSPVAGGLRANLGGYTEKQDDSSP